MSNDQSPIPKHTHDVQDVLGLSSLLNTKSNHNHTHALMTLEGFQERFRTLPVHAQRSFENLVRFLIQPEIKIEVTPKSEKTFIQVNIVSTHGYSMAMVKLCLKYKRLEDPIWKEAFCKNFVNGILQYQFILDTLKPNQTYDYDVYLTDQHNPSLHCRKQGTFKTELKND